MRYIQASTSAAVDDITHYINGALQEGSVLLLLSGGSNIALAVQIRNKLELNNQLTVSLIDERYGAVDHADSNWAQLIAAGFDTNNIETINVLTGNDIKTTTETFKDNLEVALQTHDTVVGIFGMGTDGHTSGVLPHSPAVESPELVTSYAGADFERITTTPASFGLFDMAFLVAYGESKREQLAELSNEFPIEEQPAQALKHCKELIIYSDQMGEIKV